MSCWTKEELENGPTHPLEFKGKHWMFGKTITEKAVLTVKN